jgi:hypothetical protein
MSLTTSKLKVKTPSSLKGFSLYTSTDDMITPLEPLSVRAGDSTLYAPLYPPKTITGNNVYIFTKGKKYRINEDNTVPVPTTWTRIARGSGGISWGLASDIAAGNGVFMYIGHGQMGTSPNDFRCYTSTDGINWTRKTDPFPPTSNVMNPHLAFHHNNFYCTYGADLVWSADGSTWTKFTPFGIQDGHVSDMWVNYWNQKFAYYIGVSASDNNYAELVSETANLSGSVGNQVYNKGAYGIGNTKAMFWGKHFYITGGIGISYTLFLHFDSTGTSINPSFNVPSVLLGDFLPFGAYFYIGDNVTTDGYNFASSPWPAAFQGMSEPVLVKGEDISRRMGILSKPDTDSAGYLTGTYTWYAYDHMAAASPVPILTSELRISNAVSTGGVYMLLEQGTARIGQKLWVASFP